jgi:hypothetical protein
MTKLLDEEPTTFEEEVLKGTMERIYGRRTSVHYEK